MYANSSLIKKYLYIDQTPTWKVRSLYLFGVISWLIVVYGFSGMFDVDPVYRWIVGPIILLFTTYHLLAFIINVCYKRFNFEKHIQFREEYWNHHSEPLVDIFLPICGEKLETLKNSWKHIAKLEYKNMKVYVLDDSSEECEEHKKLAEKYNFHYFERPNKGEMKKAGNLKYAYERTNGEFIVVFDADFAPLPEFLYEALPYTSDPCTGPKKLDTLQSNLSQWFAGWPAGA